MCARRSPVFVEGECAVFSAIMPSGFDLFANFVSRRRQNIFDEGNVLSDKQRDKSVIPLYVPNTRLSVGDVLFQFVYDIWGFCFGVGFYRLD